MFTIPSAVEMQIGIEQLCEAQQLLAFSIHYIPSLSKQWYAYLHVEFPDGHAQAFSTEQYTTLAALLANAYSDVAQKITSAQMEHQPPLQATPPGIYARTQVADVSYITPGKLYAVQESSHKLGFDWQADNGEMHYSCWEGSSHLNGGDWERVVIPADSMEHEA